MLYKLQGDIPYDRLYIISKIATIQTVSIPNYYLLTIKEKLDLKAFNSYVLNIEYGLNTISLLSFATQSDAISFMKTCASHIFEEIAIKYSNIPHYTDSYLVWHYVREPSTLTPIEVDKYEPIQLGPWLSYISIDPNFPFTL